MSSEGSVSGAEKPVDWEPYKLFRARVQNEYDLMNQRVNTFIFTQAFLVALLGTVLRSDFPAAVSASPTFLAFLLSFMGLIIAIAVTLAFRASLSEVRRLRNLYDQHLVPSYPSHVTKILTGGEEEHVSGDWAGHFVCILGLALWGFLIVVFGNMLLLA